MKKYFLPPKDSDKANWLKGFAATLPEVKARFNIPNATVQDMQDSAEFFDWCVRYKISVDAYCQAVTAFVNEMRTGEGAGKNQPTIPMPPVVVPPAVVPNNNIFGRVLSLSNTIKANLLYNEGIGAGLGIEGSKKVLDLVESQPKPKVKVGDVGHPELTVNKYGFKQYDVYADHGEGKFSFLMRVTKRKYIDLTPLPPDQGTAIWKYKVVYVHQEKQVAKYSGEVAVTVTGN